MPEELFHEARSIEQVLERAKKATSSDEATLDPKAREAMDNFLALCEAQSINDETPSKDLIYALRFISRSHGLRDAIQGIATSDKDCIALNMSSEQQLALNTLHDELTALVRSDKDLMEHVKPVIFPLNILRNAPSNQSLRTLVEACEKTVINETAIAANGHALNVIQDNLPNEIQALATPDTPKPE